MAKHLYIKPAFTTDMKATVDPKIKSRPYFDINTALFDTAHNSGYTSKTNLMKAVMRKHEYLLSHAKKACYSCKEWF